MFPAIKSDQSVIAALADLPAHWEERSARRVPDAGREQVLGRSRKIVEAAYDLLEEEGLEGLTVRAVLNRTGLSRRAFYERFEGKDDLVLAVFEQTIRAATIHFSKLIGTLAAPIERLELIVTHIVLGRTSLVLADHASSNRRGVRSPLAASSPLGSESAVSSGGNGVSGRSQGITYRFCHDGSGIIVRAQGIPGSSNPRDTRPGAKSLCQRRPGLHLSVWSRNRKARSVRDCAGTGDRAGCAPATAHR